jgi:probable rRNA maturation factor
MKNSKKEITINIFNETEARPIPRKRIIYAVDNVLLYEKIFDAIINVIIVDDKAMQQINMEYLSIDEPTDVISFRLWDNEEAEDAETPAAETLLGEIYISVETAEANAELFETTWLDEVVRYSIHGILHILGYDDATNEGREQMRKLEEKFLSQRYYLS